jgi:hypothetical protein
VTRKMLIEHKFCNLETAIQALNNLGFSLTEGISSDIHHVIPAEMPPDYPMMPDDKRPRLVAIVDSEGNLTFNEPYDSNPVLMKYQERLMGLTQ